MLWKGKEKTGEFSGERQLSLLQVDVHRLLPDRHQHPLAYHQLRSFSNYLKEAKPLRLSVKIAMIVHVSERSALNSYSATSGSKNAQLCLIESECRQPP